MLVCFGAAWPVSIFRSYTSRQTGGKSFVFLLVIETGYIAGIIHKLIYNTDLVIWLYFLNCTMVFVDIILYIRNKKLEKAVPTI